MQKRWSIQRTDGRTDGRAVQSLHAWVINKKHERSTVMLNLKCHNLNCKYFPRDRVSCPKHDLFLLIGFRFKLYLPTQAANILYGPAHPCRLGNPVADKTSLHTSGLDGKILGSMNSNHDTNHFGFLLSTYSMYSCFASSKVRICA